MKKTSKIIIGIIVLVVVVWGGVKLLGTKDEKTKEPIKIGAILPFNWPSILCWRRHVLCHSNCGRRDK